MATEIPRTTAAILRRLRSLDAAATKIVDHGAVGATFACRLTLAQVAQTLPGLDVQCAGYRRGVPLFLVKFPDSAPDGGA
jgi:hypothetical protein